MIAKNDQGDIRRCQTCLRPLMLKEEQVFCFYCEVIYPEDKKIQAETKALFDKMQIQKQVDKFKKYSLLNAKLLNASFESYQPQNPEQEKAKERAIDYATDFDLDNPHPLFIYGPYGTGKSHLAKSITDVVMAKDRTCLFFTVEKLLAKIKSTWRDKDLTEFDFMELLAKVDLLVLDDLGAERNTTREDELTWAKAMFFSIVNNRAGKHTIITMNFTIPEMVKIYGERDASRLIDDAKSIHIPGGNYRMRKLKKGDLL